LGRGDKVTEPTKPIDAVKKPNIYDVANLAGVSHQTVSRVMNDHQSIRPATREKVLAAAAQLGYRPSQAARSLATSKNNILGFLVSDTGLFGPTGMLNAMERAARKAGYFVLSVAVEAQNENAWREGIEHLGKMAIEGMVVIALDKGAVAMAIDALPNIPIVAIDTEDVGSHVTAVGIDNAKGAAMATHHLIDLGHKKILHVTGPAGSVEAASRKSGYESAMRTANLQPLFAQGDWSAATGYALGASMDVAAQTAVFTGNDHLALGLLKALGERGVKVPEQLSVVGFDDLPEAPYFVPALTTIRQDFNQLGEVAMGLLLDQLAGRVSQTPSPVLPSLILRASTSQPNGGN